MRINRIEIPGKAMLFGEYAVLAGGTAVMYPVPHYLTLTERKIMSITGYTPVMDAARALAIPELTTFEADSGEIDLDFDNRQFFNSDGSIAPCKLGLGLSAAEAVGVVGLRFRRAGFNEKDCRDKIAKYALKAHHLAQNGRGSGADVYCCAYRVPIKYKVINDKPQIEQLNLNRVDNCLPLYLVYTGKPADTRSAIDAFNLWYSNAVYKNRCLLHRLIESSDMLAEEWSKKRDEQVYGILDESIAVMKEISNAAGLPYWTDIHAGLDIWARKYGGRAKPVGAGGGDMAMVLGRVPIEEICPRRAAYCIEITSGILQENRYPFGADIFVKSQ